MKRSLLVLLATCAFASAMIPRDRRAINTEEFAETTTPAAEHRICDKMTPCVWEIYNPIQKTIQLTMTNTYCSCGPGTVCLYDEDDPQVYSYVHRCKPAKGDES